ncbi:uncharacterized protein Tco025E_03787 [Trypanosoma conorhini]|uniref:Uncharacterized protein n=1 Tax=Trypanosoma conorhini TaxID=83891 RepID=A0A3R7L3M9_9TRYP|nr:uncharacterized protein Tco025E_03787 [Trypanosoma conorhini]RNF20429.1 hypothetical protein Tco025E_03787 [Trypanosoma conorhini]
MPATEKKSGVRSAPALEYPHDFYRTMRFHHWRRFCEFCQYYDPLAVPNWRAWLQQCSGHGEVLLEELRQIYGPEPAQLSALERARTRGSPDGPPATTAEEGVLFQALFAANAQAKQREEHRAELEKEVVVFLAEKGICSSGVSARLVDSFGGDGAELFRALEGALGRQRAPSLRAAPPLLVDLLSSRSHADPGWRNGPGLLRHPLRLADAALPAASNFLEWSERPSPGAAPVGPTSAAPAFATFHAPSGGAHVAVGRPGEQHTGSSVCDTEGTTHCTWFSRGGRHASDGPEGK